MIFPRVLPQEEARIVPIGGKACDALIDHPGRAHRRIMAVGFRNPAAVQGGHGKAARQIQAKAHEFGHMNRRCRAVFQDSPPGENAAEQGPIQGQLQTIGLTQGDLQGFRLAPGLGQPRGHGDDSPVDAVGSIAEVRGAFLQADGTLPEIALARAAPFPGQHIQTGSVGFVIGNGAAPTQTGLAGQGRRIGCLHRRTEMQMLQLPMGTHTKQCGKRVGFQQEHAVIAGYHGHRLLSMVSFYPRLFFPSTNFYGILKEKE